MVETELKLQIPPERLDKLRRAVSTRSATRQSLRATYFDTPDRALARHRIAIRIRREGRSWVQTAKALGDDPMTRLEHELQLSTGSTPDQGPDIGLHSEHAELHRRIVAALAEAAGPLAATYTTRIERTQRLVRQGLARIEIALDEGVIDAGSASVTVSEIEFELKAGRPDALLSVAAGWAARHGLWLDIRSKAQRGDRLAQGLLSPAALKFEAKPLANDMKPSCALAIGVRSALEQVLANAAELADVTELGDADVHRDPVHQCRVGLRRLRAVLEVHDRWAGPLADATRAVANSAAEQFRLLGGTRDRDVLAAYLTAPLHEAGLAWPQPTPLPDHLPCGAVVRSEAFMRFCFAALQLSVALDAASADVPARELPAGAEPRSDPVDRIESLRSLANRDLRRQWKRLARRAEHFARLEIDEQHAVRKQAKRLRYALDFCASLYPAKRVSRFAKPLAAAQDALGVYTDVLMGEDLLRRESADDPAIAFARGWLSGRRPAALVACEAPLRKLLKAERPWD